MTSARRFNVAWISALALFLVVSLSDLQTASAATNVSSMSLVSINVSGNSCYWNQSQGIHPASNGSNVDYKTFVYKRVRSTTFGCVSTASLLTFFNSELTLRAQLFRVFDYTVCSSTGYFATPNGWSGGFGVGRTWNKPSSGSCAATQTFQVQGDGLVSGASSFYGPLTTVFTL